MKVYSLSFFRHPASAYESPRCGASQGRFFVNFLPIVIRAFRSILAHDGWALRIHHDDQAREFPYFRVLKRLAEAGLLQLKDMGVAETLCGSMMWRMAPIWEHGVETVVCRDLDSLPTVRERAALDRWLAHGKPVSAMRDSVSHNGTRLLGGMVGFQADWFRETVCRTSGEWFSSARHSGLNLDMHGADQLWLESQVWPKCGEAGAEMETTQSLGPRIDPRDLLSNHIGGAFHAEPARKWYDENLPDEQIMQIEREVLGK